ncbi:MAG: hypothetical protein GY804_11365, partial [Alphaproteobacteria bacterium]|nr:hypothetical protein [Alphaproteobacteria bacterium]
MRMVLKAANTDTPAIINASAMDQMITFDTFKLNEPKMSYDDENGDMIHRNVIDALHVPAVITRLSDSRVMYYNKKAQDKFGMTDLCVVKMSDLYVNKKDYDN